MRLFLSCIFAVFFFTSEAQIVINELDADTEGADLIEFIELLSTPNFSLDGHVLVFFNGSSSGGDASYFAIDLDGAVTDANGILLIGSANVSPVPQVLISANVIQNGADAVGLYIGNDFDFPQGTPATTNNLVDALAYDTNDSDDTVLMALLGLTEQINEAQNGNKDFESIQRLNGGGYEVKFPTPGQLNDGSGIEFNGLSFSTTMSEYGEGDTFDIVFDTEEVVTSDLNYSFSLSNAGFNTSDYTGSTSVTIPSGGNTATSTIQIIDDADNEGDEIMVISIGALPSGFNKLNDNEEIRVIDNDFTSQPWGNPLNPTYGLVASTQPAAYYDALNGESGAELVQAIQDIVADRSTVRAQTYADIIDILQEADQSPENSNQVWLLYTEQQRAKIDFQTTSSSIGKWNREHVYPRSRGGFSSIEADEIADGIDIYWTTNADSLRHGNSDAHALRAADGPENSSRGNQDYGEYQGPTGNLGSWKGDVARSVFYMTIRYNGLEVVNGNPGNSTAGELGDLATLVQWHRDDPPDDYEMNRNNVVYSWQFNRNPFIDLPDLVEYIWGNNIGEVWNDTFSTTTINASTISMYPNPVKDQLFVSGLRSQATMEIYNTMGQMVSTRNIKEEGSIPIEVPEGLYLVRLKTDTAIITKKIYVIP